MMMMTEMDDKNRPIAELCNSTKQTLSSSTSSASSSSVFVWTSLARTVLLDAPLFAILVLYASVVWIHHVHDAYLEPQLQALQWTSERRDQEMTYYARSCTAQDISTHDATDLIMSSNNTAQDALHSVLKHGFAMFPSVLSRDTASALRQYIADRNANLTSDTDAIWDLHQVEHRYSFSMNAQESIVQKALMEVANHEQLSQAVEKVMGRDPALIEVSAITSEFGSIDQDYHPDVLSHASATRYARSFAPTFSIFIQLQDTTKEMGATSACAGTHVCTDGDMEELCEEQGIQVVNENGIWPQGDALLMYSNTHHRGSAHRDPDAVDRVMWVLIFTTKPQSVAESRQISSGISNRWDMWGFTWNDMKRADVFMAPTSPMAIFKSLGLFKPPSSSWGIDYITVSCNRLVQKDWIFGDEKLERLMEHYGGIPLLARLSFLQGNVDWDDDYPWHGFLVSTLVKIRDFLKTLVVSFLIGYMLLAINSQSFTFFWQSTRRLLALCGIVYLAFFMARRHVDSTQWAKDIRANRRYSSAMENEHLFVQQQLSPTTVTGTAGAATTFPNRHDVLIEQRYSSSHHLALQSNYINGAHHGNVGFYKLVRGLASTFTAYPEMFRLASARYIIDAVALDHGRFLNQGIGGHWHHVANNDEWTMSFTIKELAKHASPQLGSLMQGIRQGIGAYRFGIYRNSALASKHMVPFLRRLETKLFKESRLVMMTIPRVDQHQRPAVVTVARTTSKTPSKNNDTHIFQPVSSFVALPKTLDANDNIRKPSFILKPTEPTPGAWLESDSLVEGKVNGDWYAGRVLSVTARGFYFVRFPNGDEDMFEYDSDEIRNFEPYQIGERVELLVDEDGYQDDDEAYEWCEIVSRNEDGRYTVEMEEDDTVVEDVTTSLLRRGDD